MKNNFAIEYVQFVRDQGWQEDNRRKIISLLNQISVNEHLPLDGPLMCGLDVIAQCNLRCSHCFREYETIPLKDRLDTSTILNTIDQLDLLGVFDIYITGGEPFLRSDILEIIGHLKSYQMMTNVHTNGYFIDNHISAGLSELLVDGMDFVQVSVDAATAAAHDQVREEGSFNKAVSAIGELRRRGIPVRINMTVHDGNVADMLGVYKLAVDLDVSEIAFSPLLETRVNTSVNLPPTGHILAEFVHVIRHQRTSKNPVRISQDPIAVPCGHAELGDLLLEEFGDLPQYVCPAGSSAIEIDSLGNVYPCPYLHNPEFSAGNINEESLNDIWVRANWDKLRGHKQPKSSVCGDCKFQSGCAGACAAQSFHQTGSVDEGDTRCDRVRNSGGIFPIKVTL